VGRIVESIDVAFGSRQDDQCDAELRVGLERCVQVVVREAIEATRGEHFDQPSRVQQRWDPPLLVTVPNDAIHATATIDSCAADVDRHDVTGQVRPDATGTRGRVRIAQWSTEAAG
jgi:hypothetical protein